MPPVPIRQPRFLGERVPTREQTPQEQIQKNLGPEYIVEKRDGGFIARSKPVEYTAERDKSRNLKRRATYIPKEIYISSSGVVEKEITRGLYLSDTWSDGFSKSPFESEVTDYQKQTRYTYGKRELKSGRETIKKTSSYEQGKYREKKIIDQTSAEYDRLKRTDEQARLIREKGFLVKRTAEYKVAGLPKEQRREFYQQIAKQRTAQFSLQGKAVTLRNQARREYERDLTSSARSYATQIVVKQDALSRPKPPTVETPGPVFIQPAPGIIPEPTNPASPTTRTDLADKPFLIGGKLPTGTLQEAPKPKGLQARYERTQDLLSQKQSKARQSGESYAVVGIGAGKFALGIPAGSVNVVRAVLPWNLPETVGSIVNPESYRQLGEQLRLDPAKTTGEIVGAVGTGYAIGKGIQYGKAKIKAYRSPKDLGGPSGPASKTAPKEIRQSRLQTYDAKNYPGQAKPDIKSRSGLKSAQIPEGKGVRTGTIFSSKKVVNAKGQIVRTPSIQVTGRKIPGDPTRLGTLYEGYFSESGKLAGYKQSPPVRVRPEVQQTLTKPQIVAQSKTFAFDQRAVVVKGGQPYVKDLFGQGPLRKVQPGEFILRTTYPGRPGPTPSQSNFLSGGSQSVGGFEFTLKGSGSGTQTTLGVKPPAKPIKITIVKDPATGGFKQTYGPKVLTAPDQKAVAVVKKAPQTYATAGEVIKGTLKVEPRYSVGTQGKVFFEPDLPDYAPVPQSPIPKVTTGTGALIGLSSYQPVGSEPIQAIPQANLISPISATAPKISPIVKPSIRVDPKSLGAYDQTPAVTPASVQIPAILPSSASTTRTETITETTLRTELIPEQIFRPVTDTPPTTGMGGGISEPIKELPPPTPFLNVGPKEKIIKKQKFKVQVREKGVFKDFKIATDLGSAFAIGKQRVLSDETASFRIRPLGSSENVLGFGRSLGPMFRESKKEPGVFIEKRQFRIDTPGEKRKITFKGLQILKVKSIFGKKRG